MRVFDRYPTIFVTIGAAIAAAVYLDFSEISLTGLGAQDLATKFLSLAFMALVIERAVEIYIKNRFSEREANLTQGARIAATSVRIYKDALAATANTILPVISAEADTAAAVTAKYNHVSDLQAKLEIARTALLQEKRDKEPQRQALQAKKKRAATIAALILSLAVAVVGLRVLAQFVPTDALGAVAQGSYQPQAFRALDIFLTALLLSGGADGIHQLLKGFLNERDALLTS